MTKGIINKHTRTHTHTSRFWFLKGADFGGFYKMAVNFVAMCLCRLYSHAYSSLCPNATAGYN